VNKAIEKMLNKYRCVTTDDHTQALREIMQEIALLGLYRGKFFEHAAFYGGTALRIFYGLDRFSEDLDFSLLKHDDKFDLKKYSTFLEKELSSYGFKVSVEIKEKAVETAVKSAFLKADTAGELITIEAAENIVGSIPSGQKIKIKIEVDTDPPGEFNTETKYLLQPTPFSVRTFDLPSLFAGKMHALLFRRWKNRVKGRDWYDFVWYISNHPVINLTHLKARMVQTKDWPEDRGLHIEDLKNIFYEKLNETDIDQAKKDAAPFLSNPEALDIWSTDFFRSIVGNIIEA
jgi:predicted nucleotidyltransferase component of viral defense system